MIILMIILILILILGIVRIRWYAFACVRIRWYAFASFCIITLPALLSGFDALFALFLVLICIDVYLRLKKHESNLLAVWLDAVKGIV